MVNDSSKNIPKSLTRWDASTYESSYVEAIRLIVQTLEPLVKTINLPKDASVLEIGVGSCKFSASFSIMGYHVTAMDSNPEMLKQGKWNFPNINIEYVVDELPDLKSEASKQKYDLVFNEGVVEHFTDKDERIAVIRAMGNCCVEGGYVFFYVPFLSDKLDEHRYTSLREMELEVREAGLVPVLVDIGVFQTQTQVYNMLRVLAKKR
jgi:2-polyprenyl-3-methyl-5-hydroxy-6-metoxy-1,4-benzoquinol methylase